MESGLQSFIVIVRDCFNLGLSPWNWKASLVQVVSQKVAAVLEPLLLQEAKDIAAITISKRSFIKKLVETKIGAKCFLSKFFYLRQVTIIICRR